MKHLKENLGFLHWPSKYYAEIQKDHKIKHRKSLLKKDNSLRTCASRDQDFHDRRVIPTVLGKRKIVLDYLTDKNLVFRSIICLVSDYILLSFGK